ncbi:bifunctional 5,10-methylenetetrahydrofolate dehydrogenase/5,10-methenyltetrahydrofolate cyclohydrolase [Candidatus Parcubacteria bacterium]|nr:MAG: bifunctional 5,10-methylenetetrahydrofolate dehydrogenase/5,10-methenyltetrahydrofolate cyclohydrolase [Candidatus Parcubacteria bacterium]
MILDGKAIAEDLYKELTEERKKVTREPKLGIVVVGDNPVINSFVRRKEHAAERLNVAMVRIDLPEDSSIDAIIGAIHDLSLRTDGVIAQLPLPKHVSTDAVLSAVPKEKDVDALNPTIPEEERPVHAPVALAVVELLKRGGVHIDGKRTVVVGAGRLVGAPSAWLLRTLGARVSMLTLQEGSIEDLQHADIIVSGAGKPGLIKPEHIPEGVALIDAGTSELNKKIRGDAEPACAEKAAVFTPVPGGVGPVAVSMIFRNLFDLMKKYQ